MLNIPGPSVSTGRGDPSQDKYWGEETGAINTLVRRDYGPFEDFEVI